jgi:hypothetical protein
MGKPQPATPAGLPGLSELENIESKNGSGSSKQQQSSQQQQSSSTEGANVGGATEGNQQQQDQKIEVPELTKEQVKALFNFDGTVEEFKAHIAKNGGSQQQKQQQEPTEEEKKKIETAFEQRVVNRFIEGGGSMEQYVALKNLANSKPEDLSLAETKRELAEAGFKEEEINSIIKEHYFQLSDDEISQYEDESDQEFAKRKREYGMKMFAGRGTGLIEKAKSALTALQNSIKAEDKMSEIEKQFSSTVDEHFSKVQKKLSFDMGEQNGQKISPVDYDLTDAEIEEVKSILKDPSKRNNFFYNEDGATLNLTNVADVLLRNAVLEKAIKKAYTTAVDRQVEEFEKVFPKSVQAVGLRSSASTNQKGSGKLVSSGKPEVARPQLK